MHDSIHSTKQPRVIELVVQNRAGVMVHIAGLFARRAFNLEGILCGPLRDTELSRMLLLIGAQVNFDQVVRHLEKLHDVLEVSERTDVNAALFDPTSWGELPASIARKQPRTG